MTKHPPRTGWLVALSLLVTLASVPHTGTAQDSPRAPEPRRDKLSPDLRASVEGAGAGARVGVILQTDGPVSGPLHSLLVRGDVHVRGSFRNLNSFAVELPAELVERVAAFNEVSFVSPD